MSTVDTKQSGLARFLGSAVTGVCEISVFHPFDTISKRLMTNTTKVDSLEKLKIVIFKDKVAAPPNKIFWSLFPGLSYAACYKILQRIYRFGGQPFVNEFLTSRFKNTYDDFFGPRIGKPLLAATAGTLIGIGEVFLSPLDALRIKKQTNPDTLKNRNFFKIIKDEGISCLYGAGGWTIARNAPGSFALFGGSAFAKEFVFDLSDYSTATLYQNFIASIYGATASLIVSAPLDVIKTRMQNRSFGASESGFSIYRNMMEKEGLTAFFKGVIPKLITTGPRLVFSFALAQSLIPAFDRLLK